MALRRFFSTPKGLLIIGLAVLVLLSAEAREGLSVVGPGLGAAILVAGLIDTAVLRKQNGAWIFPDGAVLTGLFIAMLLSPHEPWHVAAVASALAVVSKYIFRSRWANVFNPAALALVAVFYIFAASQNWWGAMAELPPVGLIPLFVIGVFIADRVNKMPMVVAFLAAYYFVFTLTAFLGNPQRVAEIFRAPDLHASLFFAFFILTDPPTSPVRYRDQVTYSLIVALSAYLFFEVIGAVYYLLAGVLVGNVWEAWRRWYTSSRRKAGHARINDVQGTALQNNSKGDGRDTPLRILDRCAFRSGSSTWYILRRVRRDIRMSRIGLRGLAVGFGLLLIAIPISAHHNITAKFDPGKTRTLKGTVTKLDWANPHVHVLMDVLDGKIVTNWAVELESTLDLERSGWTLTTLKPGDEITVQGMIARDGSPQIWGESVVLAATRKRVLDVSAVAKAALLPASNLPSRPTPRWPDGKPRLGPPPGEKGYWGRPSSRVLMETGANVQMNEYGLLRNIADVDKVAPFQKWARDLYEYRQRNFLKDDPLFLQCLPPGPIRQFQIPYGVQFLEDKNFGRIFLVEGGGSHLWHFIYTDGRPQTGDPRGNADNPLYYGNARGTWDGDTLVVDSKMFNEKFWFSNGGLPHTERLHLIERFTRTDFNTLKYEVTIDDPGAYTKTWSAGWTLQWVPEDLPTYYCQDNRQ